MLARHLGGPAVAQPPARTPARSGPGDSLAESLAAASGPRAGPGPVSVTVARLSGGRLGRSHGDRDSE